MKMIKQCEDYIEISHDLDVCMEMIQIQTRLTENEWELLLNINYLMCRPYSVLEAFSSAAVMLYCKSFGMSKGRVSLESKIDDIFSEDEDLKSIHHKIDRLRDKFFAHHELRANNHHLFFSVKGDEVRLNVDGQHARVVISDAIEWGAFYQCVSKVKEYVLKQSKKFADKILNDMSKEQRELLVSISLGEAMPHYSETLKSPLIERKSSPKKGEGI